MNDFKRRWATIDLNMYLNLNLSESINCVYIFNVSKVSSWEVINGCDPKKLVFLLKKRTQQKVFFFFFFFFSLDLIHCLKINWMTRRFWIFNWKSSYLWSLSRWLKSGLRFYSWESWVKYRNWNSENCNPNFNLNLFISI